MYASNKHFNVEALAQVAYGVSVHDVDVFNDNWVCRSSDINSSCITMGDRGLCSALMYFNSNVNITGFLERDYTKEQTVENIIEYVRGYCNMRFDSGVTGTACNGDNTYCLITLGNIPPCNHFSAFFNPMDGGSKIEEAISLLKNSIEENIKDVEGEFSYLGITPKFITLDNFKFGRDWSTLKNKLEGLLESK
jgi:hypothetical protein